MTWLADNGYVEGLRGGVAGGVGSGHGDSRRRCAAVEDTRLNGPDRNVSDPVNRYERDAAPGKPVLPVDRDGIPASLCVGRTARINNLSACSHDGPVPNHAPDRRLRELHGCNHVILELRGPDRPGRQLQRGVRRSAEREDRTAKSTTRDRVPPSMSNKRYDQAPVDAHQSLLTNIA
jgi:hypothetical protein